MTDRDYLAASLARRAPTWQVASHIAGLGLRLPGSVAAELAQLAAHHGWVASDDFDQVVPAIEQVATYGRLFAPHEINASDPSAVRALVVEGLAALGLDRFPSAESALVRRRDLPLTRASLKRLRFLARLERKAARMEDGWRLRRAQMQAKSRLAYAIDGERCDDLTLAFCAYLAARANRRSLFMIGPQSRATDTISEALYAALAASPATAWEQVALVRPTSDVIERLAPEARGRLVGIFHGAMADAALALRDLYAHLPERMRAEMVMVRGVDSSRWNAYAGAFNTMRSAWIAASIAAGLDAFDSYLPGKAPRLMASDLIWWYRSQGKDLHEDTTLFAMLPKPWEVVLGEATLGREHVMERARAAGVDVSTGWTGPRERVTIERAEPEPALVHGVVVADPQLAATLRRCGVFSGGALRHVEDLPDVLVRDERHDGERVTQPVVGAGALLADAPGSPS